MDQAVIILQNRIEILQKELFELKKKFDNTIELSTRKRKSHFKSTQESQRKNKLEHREKFILINRYLNNFDLQLNSVVIKEINSETKGHFEINYNKSENEIYRSV